MIRRFLFALVVVFALRSVFASGGEFQDDLKARRARAMEQMGPQSMLVLWSAPAKVYSRDVDYKYRQDSNLYYLTGLDQEETVLVLLPGARERKEMLFIKPRDPVREHWVGHFLTREEATAQSGIAAIYLTTEFESFITSLLSRTPYGSFREQNEFDAFFRALDSGQGRLFLILSPRPSLSEPLDPVHQFANRIKERFFGFSIQDATNLLRDLRQIKTAYEQKNLEQSVEISNDAHLAGMRTARPGVWEYEVEAALEYVYRSRGALGWGYPSIVASGPNATVLHYQQGTRRMEAGDLLLVDAAANYQYLTGDITRTYPVSGTFSPPQKDIYRIVLAAQEQGIKAAKAGSKLADIQKRTVEVIKDGLFKLGLVTDKSGDQYRTWSTHGACHWIGMDVHDTGDSSRPLAPGMAFVIEPGIYIREGVLDNLPKTSENLSFIEKVRPVYEKYKNIGVRIEDSFLLTESGLKQLSAKVPRGIEEIENYMKSQSSQHAGR
ncbi:MAG TPA: aminopeptidase P family protein [Acidobacteriota bacterium]